MCMRVRSDRDEPRSDEVPECVRREWGAVAREWQLVLDERRRQVQHDRDLVPDENRGHELAEVGGAVVEGHDDRVALRYCSPVEDVERVVERRGTAFFPE